MLYASGNLAELELLKSQLSVSGIKSELRNEHTVLNLPGTILGEIWVADEDYPAAYKHFFGEPADEARRLPARSASRENVRMEALIVGLGGIALMLVAMLAAIDTWREGPGIIARFCEQLGWHFSSARIGVFYMSSITGAALIWRAVDRWREFRRSADKAKPRLRQVR